MTNQNIAAHDLGTSTGGRAYVAEYFASQLRRHDFARYINSTLAADFACALAQHLSKLRAPVSGEAEPHEVMRELLELTVKAGRRCAYDLRHAADDIPASFTRDMYLSRADMWLTTFNPGNGPKDYRADLHRTVATREMRIAALEKLCKENGIDCEEF